MALKIVTITLLLIIFYDDYRHRSIRVILLPVLFLALGVIRYQSTSYTTLLMDIGFNLIYILLMGGTVVVYLKYKYNLSNKQLAGYIGLGDILFLMCITVWFDLPGFIFFCTISFFCALVLHLMLKEVTDKRTVPLAGYQSICFLLLFLYETVSAV